MSMSQRSRKKVKYMQAYGLPNNYVYTMARKVRVAINHHLRYGFGKVDEEHISHMVREIVNSMRYEPKVEVRIQHERDLQEEAQA